MCACNLEAGCDYKMQSCNVAILSSFDITLISHKIVRSVERLLSARGNAALHPNQTSQVHMQHRNSKVLTKLQMHANGIIEAFVPSSTSADSHT